MKKALIVLIFALSILACGVVPATPPMPAVYTVAPVVVVVTATPPPMTSTPQPTFTSLPTYTPYPTQVPPTLVPTQKPQPTSTVAPAQSSSNMDDIVMNYGFVRAPKGDVNCVSGQVCRTYYNTQYGTVAMVYDNGVFTLGVVFSPKYSSVEQGKLAGAVVRDGFGTDVVKEMSSLINVFSSDPNAGSQSGQAGDYVIQVDFDSSTNILTIVIMPPGVSGTQG
jgi:hypothetical protein